MAPSFWDNLKDFLTERSVKLPRNAQQQVFRRDGLDSSFADSVKEFFKPAPREESAPMPAMMVDFQPAYVTLWRNLRDLISPPKLPPLKVTSKPVAVRPLWAKDENYQPGAGYLRRRARTAGGADPGAHRAPHRCKPRWRPRPTSLSWTFPLTFESCQPARTRPVAEVAAANTCPSLPRAGSFRAGA